MIRTNFNKGWMFSKYIDPAAGSDLSGRHDNSKQVEVVLPHDAMLYETRLPGLKNGGAMGFFPGGRYLYTKELFGEEEYRNKTVILEFEGVYMKSKVYLNEKEVGGRIYGYSAFYVDLTDKLRIGTGNLIRVVADNTQTQNSRWYTGSGIYRDVNLIVANKNHININGLRVSTKSYNPAVLEVSIDAEKQESMQITAEIIKDGRIVAAGTGEKCEIEIPDAELWDDDNPQLYDVKATLLQDGLVIDEAWDRTGIRRIEWNSDDGFSVNGKSVKFRGACVHHDHGPLGACSFRKAEYRKMRILKEAGYNAVRTAHNPVNRAFLDACDEIGLYVMHETFDTWLSKKSDYDYALYFREEWKKDVTGMVMSSLNHPSVVMYAIGNEILETGTPEGAEISREMHDLCRNLDPTRPTINCFNLLATGMGAMGVGVNKNDTSPDDIVDPYLEADDSRKSGSALVNVLITLMPLLTRIFGSPGKMEKVAVDSLSAVDLVGINYGEHAYEKFHEKHPDWVMVASETFPPAIGKNWEVIKNAPHILGDFMWTGWDYLGEAGVGLPVYGKGRRSFSKPYPCISAGCGSVDITGYIDSPAYYAAVVWGLYKNPYIGARPVNHVGEKVFLGQWRGTDAVNSWSWTGQEGHKAEVEIFSRGSAVELWQDGKSLGRKKLAGYKAMFKTTWNPGVLEAVSYDDAGRALGRSILKSASKDTCLTVYPEDTEIKADGFDLAYFVINISDPEGIPKMLEDRPVKITVDGAGTLIAVGSGNIETVELFTGDSYTTCNGRMIAIVRSSGEKGDITLKASAEGLDSKSVEIKAV